LFLSYKNKRERVMNKLANKLCYSIFFVCIIIFLGLTLYEISNYPGINGDEAWYGNKAYYIHQTSVLKNLSGMGNYTGVIVPFTFYVFNLIFGFSYATCRLASVCGGLITVILTFIFLRKKFSNTTAIATTLILITSIFFISYSRFATQHIWLTTYLIAAYFFFDKSFETEKITAKIFCLMLSIFTIALSIQILPPTILFYIFMLSYLKISRANLKKIFVNKFFVVFLLIFILGTFSTFIYTSNIVLKIIKMNFGYIKDYGIFNIILELSTRFLKYCLVFNQTLAGYRSLLYFSGILPNTALQIFMQILYACSLVLTLTLLFSNNNRDKMLIKYLLLTFFLTPLFLEFFNKNMHFPLLGEERYLFTFYPFVIIAIVRALELIIIQRLSSTKFFWLIIILIFILQISLFAFFYIRPFKTIGGADGISTDRLIFAVNKKPVISELYDWLEYDLKLDFTNDIVIVPSFWTFQPLKFLALNKFKNLYFWPEKTIPKIWITDNDWQKYEFTTIGLTKFLKNFENQKIYFICFATDEYKNKYLPRFEQEQYNTKLLKTFYKKNKFQILNVYEIKK